MLPEVCARCGGTELVCENHPEVQWEKCGCGGAGMPCVCLKMRLLRGMMQESCAHA